MKKKKAVRNNIREYRPFLRQHLPRFNFVKNSPVMKTILTSLLLLALSTGMKAQDTIFRKDGVKVIAKVLEVGPEEVRYKNAANPDGPLYVVRLYEIDRIAYPGGTEDVFGKKKRSNYADPSVPVRKNTITMNAFDLMFGIVTLDYERNLNNKNLSLDISASSGVNSWNKDSRAYTNTDNIVYYSSNKPFSSALSLNIFSNGQDKPYNFFLGPRLEGGAYYNLYYPYIEFWQGTPSVETGWFGSAALQAGFKMRPTKAMSITVRSAMGMSYRSLPTYVYYNGSSHVIPTARLELNAGWAF